MTVMVPFECATDSSRRLSLLLDVDGTLLHYAPHPDAVVVSPALIRLLGDLQAVCQGAVALVSGRSIPALDRLFYPLRTAAVGVHGSEHRQTAEARIQYQSVAVPPPSLRLAISRIAHTYPNTRIEDKGTAIAVHHRLAAPTMHALQRALRTACLAGHADWTVLRGRRVLEIKPVSITKAHGVDALMVQAPFAQTLPVSLGDDLTDLDMFAAVRRHGGMTVAVGPRIARYADVRLSGPEQAWLVLTDLRDRLAAGESTAQALQTLPLRAPR